MTRRLPFVPLSAAGRFLVGGGALVAPRIVGRAFDIDQDDDAASIYIGRLFGVRAVAMAALVLLTSGEERFRQLRAGVAVDLVDAAAAVAAGRTGQLSRRAATLACIAALSEAGIGIAALASDRKRHSAGQKTKNAVLPEPPSSTEWVRCAGTCT